MSAFSPASLARLVTFCDMRAVYIRLVFLSLAASTAAVVGGTLVCGGRVFDGIAAGGDATRRKTEKAAQ